VVNLLKEILGNTSGDIAVATHKSVIALSLCYVYGKSCYDILDYKTPYGSYTVLYYDENTGDLSADPACIGIVPHSELCDELCLELLYASDLTTDSIVRHCRAVSDEALRITDALNAADPGLLNRDLVRAAAMLHDVARLAPDHERLGAEYLKALGYPEAGDIIRQHKELDSPEINEAAVVFIADKCRKGELPVTVEQRFSFKLQSFNEPEALASAKRRYALACEVRSRINGACGSEIIRVGSFEDAFA